MHSKTLYAMIRFSDNNDKNGIISLWSESFGDSKKEIEVFLKHRYKPENTLIYEINGEIASMLFLLEGKMKINGIYHPSYYLYAACTAKKFRGKGLMGDLLKRTNSIASQRGYEYICLMPGEESLFGFYEKYGYKTVFSKKVLTLFREDIKPLNCSENIWTNPDNIRLENLRDCAFEKFDILSWDSEAVKFSFIHTELYGGKALLTDKGYCLYNENNDTLIAKEFAFTESDFEFGLALLMNVTKVDKFIIHLPSQYKTDFEKYFIQASGMIHPLSAAADEGIKNLSDAYLGLTLD